MRNLTFDIDFSLSLDRLENEDVFGGLDAILNLGLDELKDVEDPRLNGEVTLTVEGRIVEGVPETRWQPGEPGEALIETITAKVNGELVEFPELSDWLNEEIEEFAFVEWQEEQ